MTAIRKPVTRYANPVALVGDGAVIDTVTGATTTLTERITEIRATGHATGLLVQVPVQRAGAAGTLAAADINTENGVHTTQVVALAYGIKDSYGTTWEPGSIAAGTDDLTDRAFPFLWMHDPWNPVGVFRVIEDTPVHLLIEVTWDDNNPGRDAAVRAISGSAPGASVGVMLYIHPDDPDPDLIKMAELREVSQVTLGYQAVSGAGVVRTTVPDEGAPDNPENPAVKEPDTSINDAAVAVRARAYIALYGANCDTPTQ